MIYNNPLLQEIDFKMNEQTQINKNRKIVSLPYFLSKKVLIQFTDANV